MRCASPGNQSGIGRFHEKTARPGRARHRQTLTRTYRNSSSAEAGPWPRHARPNTSTSSATLRAGCCGRRIATAYANASTADSDTAPARIAELSTGTESPVPFTSAARIAPNSHALAFSPPSSAHLALWDQSASAMGSSSAGLAHSAAAAAPPARKPSPGRGSTARPASTAGGKAHAAVLGTPGETEAATGRARWPPRRRAFEAGRARCRCA
mmetsp:Transcript_10652/g.48022  ORF Transcript_10652/g.48022 Transcript_10652/m.48022 type:complete len:212 (-) Transcript_10652:4796-5431(-)